VRSFFSVCARSCGGVRISQIFFPHLAPPLFSLSEFCPLNGLKRLSFGYTPPLLFSFFLVFFFCNCRGAPLVFFFCSLFFSWRVPPLGFDVTPPCKCVGAVSTIFLPPAPPPPPEEKCLPQGVVGVFLNHHIDDHLKSPPHLLFRSPFFTNPHLEARLLLNIQTPRVLFFFFPPLSFPPP